MSGTELVHSEYVRETTATIMALRRENDALRAAILDIRNTVHLDCENVHHAKSERHTPLHTCPVVARLAKTIDAALAGEET